MKPVDDFPWRYTNGRNEQARLLLNDHVNELRELTVCVIMLTSNVFSLWRDAPRPSDVHWSCAHRHQPEGEVGQRRKAHLGPSGLSLGIESVVAKVNFPPPRPSCTNSLAMLTCCRRNFGVYPTPPITPRPPALVTAAASSGPAATFIPVKSVSCHIRVCVTCRRRTCEKDGVFNTEQLGDRCGDDGHSDSLVQ